MTRMYAVYLNGDKVTELPRQAAYDYAEILLDDAVSSDPDSIVTVSPAEKDTAA